MVRPSQHPAAIADMLVSHPHRFIYFKTRKTAGTSVEIYFEPYCWDPGKPFVEMHQRDEEVTEWGIIGSRGLPIHTRTWYNHLPASGIRAMLGEEIFDQYYKFCVIRDPFDKTVSGFWFWATPEQRLALRSAPFSAVRQAFEEWVVAQPLPVDRIIYTIDGAPVADRYIRHDRLAADMEAVCNDLGVPWEPARLKRFKANTRLRNEPFAEYYTRRAADRVAEVFAWELEYFGFPRL